ncbi:MAG: ABC transporter ATP-binding protein [Chloroflexota bacterium]|nr:MAG: ABC transporter ATP-binding protein [Chloroflexota bacterium]
MPSALRVADLRFAYPDGTTALRGVSFVIEPGEKIALVGPNGAGKSTLMLHLNGILIGDGAIDVEGVPVSPATIGRIRAMVGLVFQNPDDQLFSPTVRDDVAYGPLHMGHARAETQARVERALAAVGVLELADRMSHHLSVGQKKRVAIATVLSMDPTLLVIDEPTAGLDPRGRRQLIGVLRDMPQTMLVSTHDMRMVGEVFHRVIVMDDGHIVADGPTASILNDEALLTRHGLERW